MYPCTVHCHTLLKYCSTVPSVVQWESPKAISLHLVMYSLSVFLFFHSSFSMFICLSKELFNESSLCMCLSILKLFTGRWLCLQNSVCYAACFYCSRKIIFIYKMNQLIEGWKYLKQFHWCIFSQRKEIRM